MDLNSSYEVNNSSKSLDSCLNHSSDSDYLSLPSGFSKARNGQFATLRGKTLKEYEQQISELKSENFTLKLRVYLLEEKINPNKSKINDLGLHFGMEMEIMKLRKQIAEKDELLLELKTALMNSQANYENESKRNRDIASIYKTLHLNYQENRHCTPTTSEKNIFKSDIPKESNFNNNDAYIDLQVVTKNNDSAKISKENIIEDTEKIEKVNKVNTKKSYTMNRKINWTNPTRKHTRSKRLKKTPRITDFDNRCRESSSCTKSESNCKSHEELSHTLKEQGDSAKKRTISNPEIHSTPIISGRPKKEQFLLKQEELGKTSSKFKNLQEPLLLHIRKFCMALPDYKNEIEKIFNSKSYTILVDLLNLFEELFLYAQNIIKETNTNGIPIGPADEIINYLVNELDNIIKNKTQDKEQLEQQIEKINTSTQEMDILKKENEEIKEKLLASLNTFERKKISLENELPQRMASIASLQANLELMLTTLKKSTQDFHFIEEKFTGKTVYFENQIQSYMGQLDMAEEKLQNINQLQKIFESKSDRLTEIFNRNQYLQKELEGKLVEVDEFLKSIYYFQTKLEERCSNMDQCIKINSSLQKKIQKVANDYDNAFLEVSKRLTELNEYTFRIKNSVDHLGNHRSQVCNYITRNKSYIKTEKYPILNNAHYSRLDDHINQMKSQLKNNYKSTENLKETMSKTTLDIGKWDIENQDEKLHNVETLTDSVPAPEMNIKTGNETYKNKKLPNSKISKLLKLKEAIIINNNRDKAARVNEVGDIKGNTTEKNIFLDNSGDCDSQKYFNHHKTFTDSSTTYLSNTLKSDIDTTNSFEIFVKECLMTERPSDCILQVKKNKEYVGESQLLNLPAGGDGKNKQNTFLLDERIPKYFY